MSDIIQEGPWVQCRSSPGVSGPGSWGAVAEGSDWAVWQVDVTHRPIVMICGVRVER